MTLHSSFAFLQSTRATGAQACRPLLGRHFKHPQRKHFRLGYAASEVRNSTPGRGLRPFLRAPQRIEAEAICHP